MTHATAFFGPKPTEASVRDVPLFAPRAQADGLYLRLMSFDRPKKEIGARRLLNVLFGDNRRPTRLSMATGVVLQHASPHSPHPPPTPVREVKEKADVVDEEVEMYVSEVYEDSVAKVDLQEEVEGEERKQGRKKERGQEKGFNLFNACRQLSVKSDLEAVKGRVAVVARGVCDFAQKVGFMQDAGAVGVIVVNSKEEDNNLANMKLNETKENAVINIPAVMIRYKDWMRIAPCRNDTTVEFSADGEATFDSDYGRDGRDALNWAMMRGMALWILCQCGVNVVRHKRRVSESRARADAIAALPVETYSRPNNNNDDNNDDNNSDDNEESSYRGSDETEGMEEVVGLVESGSIERIEGQSAVEEEEEGVCAICLETFETGQQVRQLACSHLYHQSCIDPWLQSSSNCCPLCKREVANLPPPPAQLHYGSMVV